MESCCGFSGRWNVATYLAATSTKPFAWGMSILSVEAVISEHFAASIEVTFRSGARRSDR